MLSSTDCFERFGKPELQNSMILWALPAKYRNCNLPERIYCHELMPQYLTMAFDKLIETGAIKELVEWNGCFNIRKKKGAKTMSLHSWGLAIDVNAKYNQFGGKSNLSSVFVGCFKSSGFDWGGDWFKPDPMHFQLKRDLAI